MKRNDFPNSIWEIDPRACKEHDYEELEALFLAAWEHAFYCRPPVRRIQPYLQRYLRFRVIPPWVAVYIRDVLQGEAIENLANAPLDPAIDLRRLPWRLMFGTPLPPGLARLRRRKKWQLEA